jgi:Site-specific recombinase XerD
MKSKMLYKDWLERWLKDKQEFVKEATYANYSTAVVNHIIPTLGNYTLNELTEKRLQDTAMLWLDEGRKDNQGGLSEKTVKDLIIIIKLTLKAAAKVKLIPQRNFEILFPKSETTEKLQVFSKDDQQKLTQMVYLNLTPKTSGVLFCLHTGVRIGELCAIQWKDIDLDRRVVHIDKTIQRIYTKGFDGSSQSKLLITSPKTKASVREIPLSSAIYPVLKKINPMNGEYYLLTGTEKFTEPRTFRGYYDRLLRRMDIEHINFHGLRHTFATRLIEGGADYKTVSELLGHASVNMTLNLYVHPQIEQKRKAIELITDFL